MGIKAEVGPATGAVPEEILNNSILFAVSLFKFFDDLLQVFLWNMKRTGGDA